MKILSITSHDYTEIIPAKEILINLGHDVVELEFYSFNESHSYWQKKLDEWKLSSQRTEYENHNFALLQRAMLEYRPELLFIVGASLYIPFAALLQVRELADTLKCKICCWLVDPLGALNADYAQYYDAIYTYEREDCAKIRAAGIRTDYIPIGYNPSYETDSRLAGGESDKKYDLVFIGSPYRKRRPYLELLAKAAEQENWRFRVFGIFWETQYFWKKFSMQLRFPELCRCIENRFVTPAEAAEIYRQSKIVLNLHGNEATGCNPRTYDILATGTMEIIDQRKDYDLFVPGQDFVVFQSPEDLLSKVKYYLNHPAERQTIAQRGHEKVKESRSLKKSIQRILADMEAVIKK